MKLALLFGLAVVGALNAPMWCVPGECKVDSNCVDNIHSVSGKCCGGRCVLASSGGSKLIGERCYPDDLFHADNFEQCFGTCSDGLFCDTVDEKCHAQRGVGCACLDNRECLSNTCRRNVCVGTNLPVGEVCESDSECRSRTCRTSRVCAGTNLPVGEVCESNFECRSSTCRTQSRVCAGTNLPYAAVCEDDFECQSGSCVNKTCFALAIGESCSTFAFPPPLPCVPDAVCRSNETFSSPTYCLRPCPAGEAGCCFSGTTACARNLRCDTGNYSCYALPPIVIPGLGEACTSACSDSLTMICAAPCNITGGGCAPGRVCQLKNQLQLGFPCDRFNSGQCIEGSFCLYDSVNGTYVCMAPPSDAPTGAPTGRPLNSIPLGGPCFDERNYDLCMTPGNMCEKNETGSFICKRSGTTPVGAFCSRSNINIHVRALDECVKGSQCTRNASFGGTFACRATIPVGQRCYAASNRRFDFPECENGWDNCEPTGRNNCFGNCDGNDIYGNPCCTCVAPRTVRDGGNCSTSAQCQQVTSVCFTENYTCGNIQGIDCITPDACRDTKRFDCSCDRKCYLLNAPTPSLENSRAPTASTRAPSISVPRCDAQKKAWDLLNASKTYDEWFNFPRLTYDIFHADFLTETPKLTAADQSTLIAYVCCETCFRNDRFNSRIYGGFQVDCGAKKLIKLEDTCNDLRGTWAMANCWGALSAAPSLNIGLGIFVPMLLLNLLR